MRRFLVAFVALAVSVPAEARATSSQRIDQWFFGDDQWIDGVQLNTSYLGHLGSGAGTITTPTGGFFMDAEYNLWWNHFVEADLHAFKSIASDQGFFGGGAGLKLNVLEFSKANALEFANENTAFFRAVETRRGLLSVLLRSMLLHVDVGYSYYFFSAPTGQAQYQPDQGTLEWGGGAQWGPNIRIKGISRLYLDTSAVFTRVSGAMFLIPKVGLGANF